MGQGYYTMSTEPAVSVMYREPFCRCSFVGVLCRLRCELGRTNFQNSAPKFWEHTFYVGTSTRRHTSSDFLPSHTQL